MWTPWCHTLAERMANAAGPAWKHTEDLYDVLGYDNQERKVRGDFHWN